jgi:spore coat protein JB
MQLDFFLLDLNLYLDTHPNDDKAIQDFNIYVEKARKLRSEYEKLFGPLISTFSESSNPWHWIQYQWPWERECIK